MPSFIILNSKEWRSCNKCGQPRASDFSRKIKAISSGNYDIHLGSNESHLPFVTQRLHSVKAAYLHLVECPRHDCAACKVTAGFILKVLPPGQY